MPLEPNDYRKACVAGIDLALFGPVEQTDAPVVFVTHGRGGAATRLYDWCRELAELGLIAIALDQRNHGGRLVDMRRNDGWWHRSHPADMYSTILGTAMDVSLLIDMLPATLGIATGTIGMTGGSLGGHATLMAMAMDTRIDVGAPQISSGDYRRLMELRCQANGGSEEEFAEYFNEALEAAVAKFDPINNAEVFADRYLHMINGRDDNLVQLECNERFYAAAKPHYKHPERIKLTAVAGVKHQVTDTMRTEGNAFLAEHLTSR